MLVLLKHNTSIHQKANKFVKSAFLAIAKFATLSLFLLYIEVSTLVTLFDKCKHSKGMQRREEIHQPVCSHTWH